MAGWSIASAYGTRRGIANSIAVTQPAGLSRRTAKIGTMKNLRLVTFLVLAVCAFYRSAVAQTNWSGTWTDAGSVTNISGGGNSLSASFTYKGSDYSGSGSCSNCRVAGNTATCNWTASHNDDTKSGTRTGTLEVTLSGDMITGAYHEAAPQWSYKPGYR